MNGDVSTYRCIYILWMITFIKEIIQFSMYFFYSLCFILIYFFFISSLTVSIKLKSQYLSIRDDAKASTGIEIVKSSLPFNSLALKTTSSVRFATWAILEQLWIYALKLSHNCPWAHAITYTIAMNSPQLA